MVVFDNLKNYRLHFDNFFTSPDLLVHLKKLNLLATGTVRKDRVKVDTKMSDKEPRGALKSSFDVNSELNCVTVMDSKPVTILSTAHGVQSKSFLERWDKEKRAKLPIEFPHLFTKYNKHMGGVDLHNQHCNDIIPCIRSKKWTWCLFLRIIQASISNVLVLRNTLHPDEKKGAIDIAVEIVEFSIDRFQRVKSIPSRKRVSKENVLQEHVMQDGPKRCCVHKQVGVPCSKQTSKFCKTCHISLCANHAGLHIKMFSS